MPGGPVASGSGSSANLEWTQATNAFAHSGNGHVSFNYPPTQHHRVATQETRSNAQQNIVQRSNCGSGVATPPMPQKRKKKKEKKKDKKGKKMISAPLNVRHVGMTEMLDQLQNQSKFPVEHIATMSVENQLATLSPYDSLRNVRALLQRGDTWTKQVLLCVTTTALTIKDVATKTSVLDIPLVNIVRYQFLPDPGSQGSVLMVAVDDPPRMHFFQCGRTRAEVICKEISLARESVVQSRGSDTARQRRVGVSEQQRVEALRDNWVLQAPPPPPPTISPPFIPETPPPPFTSPPHLPPFLQGSSPPPPPPSQPPPSFLPSAAPTYYHPNGDQVTAGPLPSSSPAASSRALPHTSTDGREDSASVGSAGTPSHSRNVRDMAKTAMNKPFTQSRSQMEGGEASEIRRTMKASRIQRDVDILNHVIEDLDNFIQVLKSKAAAWSELEKKKKKSKRKKHDAALEALRAKAEPPSDEEIKEAYSKCKFALNLAAKLGHHLSAPSASELQAGIFSNYISRLLSVNKGAQLASTVVSPLLTHQALELMKRKLPPAESDIWRQLGTNWFLPFEQWPKEAPLPSEYEIRFSDGCIPPNLHNSSDCPANFPTLDTLPREKRHNAEYSDAYDMANQPEAESGLLINPAVKAAVESQFAVAPAIPDIVQKKGMRKASSQHSLSSQGSQGELSRTARVLFDYAASNSQELSVHRGERVEVLDDSRKWWKVKNIQGQIGHLPGNLMEIIQPKRKNEIPEATDTIDLYGRRVPAPPKKAPPPVPSPSGRRPSISNIKYSPQPVHLSRKVSQQSHLSPLLEVSESRSSTMSRPMQHPPLAPPPHFSPPLPHQNNPGSAVPPPPLAPGSGGPPPAPPPPPVIPQKPPISLTELISQHKLKSKQEGKTRKGSVMQKGEEDNQFDIAEALKTRKPLRRTTHANLMGGAESSDGGPDLQQQLQKHLKEKKLGTIDQEEPDMECRVLPWKADRQAIKVWLVDQGYGSCADRLGKQVKEGCQLYCMDREALREMFGSSDGVRLYSQLQKDKPKSEKEAGVAKETDFQKMMRIRKTTLDHSGVAGGEPTILKLRRPQQDFKERETVLDGPVQRSVRGKTGPEHRNSQRYRGDNTTPRRHGQDDYDSQSLHRRRKLSEDYERAGHGSRGRRGDGQRSRRASRYSDTFSDDEDARMRKRRGERSQRSSRYSDSQSDSDDHSHRRKGRRGRDSGRRRRRPTNIDDFDENDLSESESYTNSSYSSDYSGSDSDSEREKRHRLRSSASASAVPDAVWALQGRTQDRVDCEARVKSQQVEIKRLLNELRELQKKCGIKTLPAEQQKTLQQDLKNLEQLQLRHKEKPGNANILTQLIGQQILLSDHLRDAIDCVKVKGLTLSTSSGSLQFHLMQQQQQQQALARQHALAQQQQRMLLEAEQQQQQQLLVAAAEQQRQLQLAQMASQQQQLLGLQSPGYGMQALSGMYNPTYVGMTYF